MEIGGIFLLASELSHVRVQLRFQIRSTYIYMYIYVWWYVKLYAHARWYVMRAGLSVTTFISIVTTSNEH